MNEYKMVINNQGYVTEGLVLIKYGIIQDYRLKEDESLAPLIDKLQDINGYKNIALMNPQWNGTEWIETATQEELNEAYPPLPTPEPTELELLKQQLLETQNALVELQYHNLLKENGVM